MKGKASCHIYTEQGRKNHDKTFSNTMERPKPCANVACKKYNVTEISRCSKHSCWAIGDGGICKEYREV